MNESMHAHRQAHSIMTNWGEGHTRLQDVNPISPSFLSLIHTQAGKCIYKHSPGRCKKKPFISLHLICVHTLHRVKAQLYFFEATDLFTGTTYRKLFFILSILSVTVIAVSSYLWTSAWAGPQMASAWWDHAWPVAGLPQMCHPGWPRIVQVLPTCTWQMLPQCSPVQTSSVDWWPILVAQQTPRAERHPHHCEEEEDTVSRMA